MLSFVIAMEAAETATAVPARAMLEQCGLLPSPPAGAVILDNACGAGVVAACLFKALDLNTKKSALTVVCGDIDLTMVDMARQRIKANGWNATAERIDAHGMINYRDCHFTHVLMNFGPQLMSDPMLTLKGTSTHPQSSSRSSLLFQLIPTRRNSSYTL